MHSTGYVVVVLDLDNMLIFCSLFFSLFLSLQAYMNELEMEVAQLVQENARLKKQQQQLCIAAADQVPKKNSLFRTSTAPF